MAAAQREQQAVPALPRARDLIVRQRTQIVNMLRDVLAEFGIVVRQGTGHAIAFARRCLEGTEAGLPDPARDVVTNLCHQLVALHHRVLWYGRQLSRVAAHDERVSQLRTIPGVGPITVYAVVASIGDGHPVPIGRSFAAWLGLTPLMQQVLGIPEREKKPNVEHHCQADDLGAGFEILERAALFLIWQG